MGAFRRLFVYVTRYRRAFLAGLACTVVTQAVTLASPKVLQFAIDDLTRGVTRVKLFEYGTALLAIGLVGGVFRFLMRRILIGASRDIEYDMRNDFFAHLEKLPASYFQAHRTGDLMSRATNDLNAVRMMIGPSVMYSANTILTFVVALAMMLAIDAKLTLYALIPLPFVSVSVKYFGSAIHRRFEQIQAQLSEVSAVAQEALAGVRVVRAYRQEHSELDRFRDANTEYLRRNRRLITLQGFFFPSMSFFLGLGALLVIWLGSREVIRGRITVGEFVAFNAYLTMLSWPMIAFGWVTNMLQRGMASWKRMLEVLETEPSIADWGLRIADYNPPPQSPIRNVDGSIEFRDLTFAYGDRPVLSHVSATIPAGQIVALVGPTGSGKSTLISLLARLYDPPAGTVFVDGVDVREIPLATLRDAVGFVPQEPFLFSDTIADNIAFGFDADPDARLKASRSRRAGVRGRNGARGFSRACGPHRGRRRGLPSRQGRRRLSQRLRHRRRRARHHAVRRTEAAHRHRARGDPRSADSGARRCALRGRHVYRGGDSVATSGCDARTDLDHRVASHLDCPPRGPDFRAGRRPDRGARARTMAWSRSGGLYAELYRKQLLEEELAAS